LEQGLAADDTRSCEGLNDSGWREDMQKSTIQVKSEGLWSRDRQFEGGWPRETTNEFCEEERSKGLTRKRTQFDLKTEILLTRIEGATGGVGAR